MIHRINNPYGIENNRYGGRFIDETGRINIVVLGDINNYAYLSAKVVPGKYSCE